MKISRPDLKGPTEDGLATNRRAGFALEASLMIMLLISGLILVLIQTSTTSFRSGFLDYTSSRAFYAAEAGAEWAMSRLTVALQDATLDAEELSSIHPPRLEGFSFDSFAVEKVGGVEIETITDGPYAGMYSQTQDVTVHSEARAPTGSTNAILVSAKAQAIPIFQFGVFFEKDLEATNGPPMEFAGRVHSNGNIYLSSNNAWYRDEITTPNKIFHDRKDNHDVKDGVYVDDAAGNEVQLDFDSRTHPDPDDFRAESDQKFDGRVKTDAHGVDSLQVPLPAGMDPVEVIRPRDGNDGDREQKAKMSWKADMHVSLDFTNLSTAGDECGDSGVPYSEPDNVSANDINVTATSGICPGVDVTFTVSHPDLACADFDDRALLVEVSWGGDKYFENDPMSGCQFTVTIPNGTFEDFVIKLDLDKDDYAQLTEDQKLDAKWSKEELSDNCGDGQGGGGNKYGTKGLNTPFPAMTITRDGGEEIPDIPEMCQIFFWKYSAFFDGREEDYRDMLDVDIAALRDWVTAGGNRASEVMFVEFVLPASVPSSMTPELADNTLDPGVRLKNGALLPNALSVATHYPIYVQGDYNSVDWKPSSVMGDAITLLSNNWDDADHQDDVIIKTDAVDTEYWMAVLAGHSATPCDHEDPGCAGGYTDFYGGGIENYLRFLEDWGGDTAMFRGSLVSLHITRKEDGTWNGSYYTPPNRDWAFETRFEDPANLPPGTPVVGNVIHTAFRPIY